MHFGLPVEAGVARWNPCFWVMQPFLLRGCFRWSCAGGMKMEMCSVEQQPSWSDAPDSCTMAPHCLSLIHQLFNLEKAILMGSRTPGQLRRGLEVVPARKSCLLLTALTIPTQFLLFQFRFGLHGSQSKRSSWGLARILSSGRKFVQCLGRDLELAAPIPAELTTVGHWCVYKAGADEVLLEMHRQSPPGNTSCK